MNTMHEVTTIRCTGSLVAGPGRGFSRLG